MESLIRVFHRYAAGDGDAATLTQKELKKLMETELSTFLSVRQRVVSTLIIIIHFALGITRRPRLSDLFIFSPHSARKTLT